MPQKQDPCHSEIVFKIKKLISISLIVFFYDGCFCTINLGWLKNLPIYAYTYTFIFTNVLKTHEP